MANISRTCQSCASSKVRCIRNAANPHVCNRCLRLGRQCLYRQTGRRFHGFQKDRKIEALEAQVQELLTDRAMSADTSQIPSEQETNSRGASVASDDGEKDVIDRGYLTTETAQTYLIVFQTVMTPHFPFVIIPPDVSVHHLRQDKPFLFLAILAASSYENMPLQRSLGAEVKKAVSARMILNGEVSFDMLQGLLVYLAWSHYHTKPHRYTQYLQLAISVAIDLRLDRAPQGKTWKTKLQFRAEEPTNQSTYDRPLRSNDERRAVIGCFFLSSSQFLFNTNEHPHDRYMMHIVQLQHIAEKIDRLSAEHGDELTRPGSGAELYVKVVKDDLSTFQKRLPFNIYDSPLLALHFQSTSLCLYQLALNMSNQQPLSPFETAHSQSWRDELSNAAVSAVESVHSLYLSLPPASELGFTNAEWVQLGFAMLIGYRITAASPIPERKEAYLQTLALLRQRVGALSTPNVDHNGDRDVFVDFRKRIVQIQTLLDGGQKHDTPSSDFHCEGPINGTQFIEPVFTLQDADSGEWTDLPQDMLGFTEDSGLPDDFLLTTSVEQVMSNWL
ncbi:unnamed protein product [Penicillium pancosmium]